MVVEERPNERVNLLMGLSETGIRLISVNPDQVQDSMIIQDHFEYVFLNYFLKEKKLINLNLVGNKLFLKHEMPVIFFNLSLAIELTLFSQIFQISQRCCF